MARGIPVHDCANKQIFIRMCLCFITICVNASCRAVLYKSVPCASVTASIRSVEVHLDETLTDAALVAFSLSTYELSRVSLDSAVLL